MPRLGGGTVLIVFFVIRNLVVECQDRRIIIHVPHRVQMVHHHHHHVVLMDPKTRTVTRAAGPLPQPNEMPRSSSEEDSYAQLTSRRGCQQHAQLQTDAAVYPAVRLPAVDASHSFAGWPVRNKRSKLVNRRHYVLVKSSDY